MSSTPALSRMKRYTRKPERRNGRRTSTEEGYDLFGHTVRQPEDTPMRQALIYARKPYDRPAGKPRTTWLSQVTAQISAELNMSLQEAIAVAQNREEWRSLCG